MSVMLFSHFRSIVAVESIYHIHVRRPSAAGNGVSPNRHASIDAPFVGRQVFFSGDVEDNAQIQQGSDVPRQWMDSTQCII